MSTVPSAYLVNVLHNPAFCVFAGGCIRVLRGLRRQRVYIWPPADRLCHGARRRLGGAETSYYCWAGVHGCVSLSLRAIYHFCVGHYMEVREYNGTTGFNCNALWALTDLFVLQTWR